MATIDLNADVGEECGDDAALLAVVSTASVAAGGHAGGGDVLHATVRTAAAAGVAVGAHPSYPDRAGFGRVSKAVDHGPGGIADFVRDQVLDVAAACAAQGVRLAHVKAHGALYHDAAGDPDLAEAFLSGVLAAERDLGASLPVMGLPGSVLAGRCAGRGIRYLPEAYADRAYASDGSLVPRSVPGAVLDDPEEVAMRVVRLVREGTIEAIDGTDVPIAAVTVCVHGDTPGAVAIARRVRQALEEGGVQITALAGGGAP